MFCTKPDVSIIICVYNQLFSLNLIIDSLKQQIPSIDYNFELLVTDDGSDEDILSSLKKADLESFFSGWKYFWQPDKDFLAGQARNMAIRNAQGDFIILLDGDMIPGSKFLNQHITFHSKNKNKIVSGGRKLLYYKDIKTYNTVDFSQFSKHAVANEEEEAYRKEWYESDLPWKALFSSNLSFPNKKDLLFNESFVGWGIEDWEFCLQATRKGLGPEFKPEFTTFHVDKDDAVFNVFRLNSSNGMAKFARNVFIFLDENPGIDLTSCAVALRHYVIRDNELQWSPTVVTPSIDAAIDKTRNWLAQNKIY